MAPVTDAAQTILATERAAFERWAAGEVTGFLEISEPEVTYFDPFIDKRLDGLDALRALYTPLQGTFKVDHWEMVDPKLAVASPPLRYTGAVLAHNSGQPNSHGAAPLISTSHQSGLE